MKYEYYILSRVTNEISGPYSFSAAIREKARSTVPVVILKEVVDELGRAR